MNYNANQSGGQSPQVKATSELVSLGAVIARTRPVAMNNEGTIPWWGFRRRPPRFWRPKMVLPWEALGLAAPPDYIRLELPCDELPEQSRRLGVQLRAGLRQQMEDKLRELGPAHFRKNKYKAALGMIDPAAGPLDGAGSLELRRLAALILSRANHAGWTRLRLAEVVLHMVQRSIRYKSDAESTGIDEYGRFPLQTLADGEGDCEDTAMLVCSLLAHLGIECALLLAESESTGHAAAALKVSGRHGRLADGGEGLIHHGKSWWLYGETATDGTLLAWGPMPPGLRIKHLLPVPTVG
jgi:predicted transglutaminase-like cysteine proteinase